LSAAYTHIAMVTKASNNDLMEVKKIDSRIISAISRNFKYCELGSISPDYSYLAFWARWTFQGNENIWSDKMHYEKTGEFIHLGIEKIKLMPESQEKNKCIAWLFGYAAHMTTDTVIHPIVENIVGGYELHKKQHRICEMNQDVYIFNTLDLGKITKCEYFDDGIKTCGKNNQLDLKIYKLWKDILETNYNDLFKTNAPNIHQWHFGFNTCIDKFADNGGIPVLSRHIFDESWLEKTQKILFKTFAFSYPSKSDEIFINNLKTPHGQMNFLEIFYKAQDHVLDTWKYMSDAIYNNCILYKEKILNWDMGTGRNQVTKTFAFWNGEFQ